ncbi:hypothetical protein HMPREF9577_00147, partial [Cutibacterium acnes HL110PA3]
MRSETPQRDDAMTTMVTSTVWLRRTWAGGGSRRRKDGPRNVVVG